MAHRGAPVPITPFQSRVLRLLASHRTEDSYLAGATILHLSPTSRRFSADLDYFHDSVERVASAFAEDRAALEAAGCRVEIATAQPGYISATITDGPDRTALEWSRDTAWRFLPLVRDDAVGYALHPVDAAVNKVLALAGREEPRDYLDVLDLHAELLPLSALCWAACGKDPGFSPTSLLELLRRKGRYRPEDFARLALTSRPDIEALKRQWLAALEAAERDFQRMPNDERGCLYWSESRRAFGWPIPKRSAVAGMSCIRPTAPAGETASVLPALSIPMIARTSAGDTCVPTVASSISRPCAAATSCRS